MTKLLTKRDKATHERRKHILEAATACFVEKGFHQTGMREIAKRANVSLGNLYNHFPGKHDLLVAFADQEIVVTEPFIALLERDVPAQDGLKDFIKSYCKGCSDQEAAILFLDIAAEAMRQPGIAKRFLKVRANLAVALSSLIALGVADKKFSLTIPNFDMANLILDLIESSAARGAIEGITSRELAPRIEAMVFAALRN